MKEHDSFDSKTLENLIAEVDRAAQRREQGLDRGEVEQILKDLNLPPELLDEAMQELRKREALEEQKKRRWRIGVGITVAVIAIVSSFGVYTYHRQQALANIEAGRDRLTPEQDQGQDLDKIAREENPLIYYRVTLRNAPTGRRLQLQCNWINPNGTIVEKNTYETNNVIDSSVWETHCRKQFGSAYQQGTWKVQMQLGNGRQLSRQTFEVQ